MQGEPAAFGFDKLLQHTQLHISSRLHLGDVGLGNAENFSHLRLGETQRQSKRLETLDPFADLHDEGFDARFFLRTELRIPRNRPSLGSRL